MCVLHFGKGKQLLGEGLSIYLSSAASLLSTARDRKVNSEMLNILNVTNCFSFQAPYHLGCFNALPKMQMPRTGCYIIPSTLVF